MSRPMLTGAGAGTLILLMTLLALPAAASTPESDEPFLARAFEVHYRSLTDAADLVGELLSADGSLTIKPRMKTKVPSLPPKKTPLCGRKPKSWLCLKPIAI